MRRNDLVTSLVAMVVILVFSTAAFAQGGSKLQVHGYLSQAYAFSDGGDDGDGDLVDGEGTFLGIPEDGTSDYRTLAMQFRYAMSDNEAFVIQFSHEKVGLSPINEFRSDVELDWAFYQRTFGNGISAKVGRVDLPFGIFNEIRDVGTLLPFYRPDQNVYGEGTFSTETVNGVTAGHTIDMDDWSIDLDAFYGHSTVLTPTATGWQEQMLEDVMGGHVWLNLPVEGLRVGGGAFMTDATVENDPDGETEVDFVRAAGEYLHEKIQLRGEWTRTTWDGGEVTSYYALATVPIEKFSLNAMYTKSENELTIFVPFPPPGADMTFEGDWDKEYAFGINYHHRYDVVVKLEHHVNEGFNGDQMSFVAFPDTPADFNYSILSLSVAY